MPPLVAFPDLADDRRWVAAFTLGEVGELDGERPVDFAGALGELIEQRLRDRGDLGLTVHDRPECHAESCGQLRSQDGLVETAERALVVFEEAGVEREPASVVGLHLAGHDEMCVELRVVGSAGRLAERGYRVASGRELGVGQHI